MTSDAFQLGSIKKISILLYKRKRHARWNCRSTNEKYRRRKTDIDYYVCCTYVIRSVTFLAVDRNTHTKLKKKPQTFFPFTLSWDLSFGGFQSFNETDEVLKEIKKQTSEMYEKDRMGKMLSLHSVGFFSVHLIRSFPKFIYSRSSWDSFHSFL